MDLNANAGVRSVCAVILFQPSAHFAGLHAYHRIIPGCVARRTVKEVYAYGSLFQPIVIALKAVLDHIREKLLTALARLKNGAAQDRFKFVEDSHSDRKSTRLNS